MFLCKKCHEKTGCKALHILTSVGPCEGCKKTAECVDCKTYKKSIPSPHIRRCQYEDCQEEANELVESRKLNKVIDTCYKHAKVVVDEGNPEYTVSCPHCGCWIPVN